MPKQALSRGRPGQSNTDRVVQFTAAWMERMESAGAPCRISMRATTARPKGQAIFPWQRCAKEGTLPDKEGIAVDKNAFTTALAEDLWRRGVGCRRADVATFVDDRWDRLVHLAPVGRVADECLAYIRVMVRRRRALFALFYSLAFLGVGVVFSLVAFMIHDGVFAGGSDTLSETLWQMSLMMGPGFLLTGVVGSLYGLLAWAWSFVGAPSAERAYDDDRGQ